MPEQLRPFPPSPRRRVLARHAGLHAASPLLVGALACAALLVALALAGEAAATRAGAWIAAAARGAPALGMRDVAGAVAVLVAPLLVAAAALATLAHVIQTRALWLPRRRVAGAPTVEPARVRRAVFDLAAATGLGAVAFGWLWLAAPRIAQLSAVPLAAALAIASAAAAFAIAYAGFGIADTLLRHRALAAALHMTARDKREDERLSGADPRWRQHRARVAGSSAAPGDLGGATLLVLGEDRAGPSEPTPLAIAVAWDPVRRPVPTVTAIGRGARATQLLALARRRHLPVHRDPSLASALAGRSPSAALVVDAGPVAERHWPRLAEVVAAVKR